MLSPNRWWRLQFLPPSTESFLLVLGLFYSWLNFLFKNDPQAYDFEIKEISYIILLLIETCLHNSRNELIYS